MAMVMSMMMVRVAMVMMVVMPMNVVRAMIVLVSIMMVMATVYGRGCDGKDDVDGGIFVVDGDDEGCVEGEVDGDGGGACGYVGDDGDDCNDFSDMWFGGAYGGGSDGDDVVVNADRIYDGDSCWCRCC